MAFAMAMFCVLYSLIGFRIMKSGNMAYYTLALMSGGMMVPYVFGLLFLKEEFIWFRLIGLIMILATVIASNINGGKIDKKLFWYCCLVFLFNGLVSVVSKLHQINRIFNHVSAIEFVMYTGIMKMVSCTVVLFLSADKKNYKHSNAMYSVIAITLISALASGTSYMLQLTGAEKLPASVLYPFITGGSIVMASLTGAIFFKEKLSKRMVMCVIICFVGTFLFL